MRSAYRLWFCSVTAEWLVTRGSTTLYRAPFDLDAYSAIRRLEATGTATTP